MKNRETVERRCVICRAPIALLSESQLCDACSVDLARRRSSGELEVCAYCDRTAFLRRAIESTRADGHIRITRSEPRCLVHLMGPPPARLGKITRLGNRIERRRKER